MDTGSDNSAGRPGGEQSGSSAEDGRHHPVFRERRNLLLAMGVGAINVAALRRIGAGGSTGRTAAGKPLAPGATTSATAAPFDAGSETIHLTSATNAELPPALAGAADMPPESHVYDLVISDGRVIDPDSGFDGMAHIGIDGGTITGISTTPLNGQRRIDATGRIVSPGFIDLLSYEPNQFGVWFKLADGVTTNLAMHGVNNYAEAFFRRYENQTPIHFGGAFHHHFMRGVDLKVGIEDELTDGEFAKLTALAEANLARGFAGISFSPEYSPGTTTDEMTQLVGLAASRGHTSFFHVRHSDPNPPGTSLEAIEEVLNIAARTGASAHIEHLSSTGGTFVMHQAIELINAYRENGLDVTACIYPYDFWGTFLGSSRFSLGWQERYRLSEEDLQVAGTPDRLNAKTFGAALRDNKLVAAHGSIPEAEIQLALAEPWVLVASDAIPTAGLNNHPRGAGTFSRTIGRYVRDLGVLDLREGLAKITIGPAKRVESMIPAMGAKGRLQRGADADVVIFDPLTIGDRATVAEPAVSSVGIDWVLVDGQIALRAGQPDKSILAGRPLRSRW